MVRTYTQQKPIDRVKKLFTIVYTTLVDHDSFLSYAPIALVASCMFFGASWTVFYLANDPARYQCYALTFWLGSSAVHLLPAAQCAFLHIQGTQPPFHMLPEEYPPLTLLPFSLALLSPLPYYQVAFAVLMSLVAMLVYWLLLTYGPRGSTLIFALYLFIGALATAQIRYDLIPATLTLLCLIAAEHKHWTSAYVALAFGVLMKIYPLLLLPALFVAEQYADTDNLFITKPPFSLQDEQWLRTCIHSISRWRWKNCIIFFTIIVVVTAGFAVLDFQGAVVSQLQYFAQRPIQIESLDSTILWLAQGLGYPLHIAYTFGSINSYSSLSSAVGSLSTTCFLLGCLYITWLQMRGRLNLAQSFIALLLLFIVTGKVFSPQYLLWLIPLLAYTAAFDGVWISLWGMLSALTTFMFVFYYSHLIPGRGDTQTQVASLHGFFELLAVRNLLLALLTLSYIYNWFQIRQRKPRPAVA